jgi:TRAP-type C4-dicarboxylate transport system substrate-binding protein
MKKLFVILGIIVFASVLIISVCVEPAPTPAPGSTPIPEPTGVIELILASGSAPAGPIAAGIKQWADNITQASGGRVKFVFYWNESLVKQTDTYAATELGICHIGNFTITLDASRFPLNLIFNLPALGLKDTHISSRIANELINNVPALAEEFKTVKLLFYYLSVPSDIHTTHKPIRVPEDTSGMKFIASATRADALSLAGATPVSQRPSDWYKSLSSGLVEGVAAGWVPLRNFGIISLIKYHTQLGAASFGMNPIVLIMNMEKWNSLPMDIQKIFDEYNQAAVENILELEDAAAAKAIKEALEAGNTLITLTPEEEQVWMGFAKPVHDKWIADTEAKGLPAVEVYKEVKSLIEKYSD